MAVDFEWSHDMANYGFRNTLQDLPGLVEDQKDQMMKAFEPLSYYYKNSLFKQLDKLDKSLDSNSQKVEYIKKFLFGESNDAPKENMIYSCVPALYKETVMTPMVINPGLQKEATSVATTVVEEGYKKRIYQSLNELDKLTGLDNVKQEIRKLVALIEISKLRRKYNYKSKKQSLHMLFKGNPGTGKTTVARMLGKILNEIGVLSIGHVIELDRSNLTSKFQGDIEQRIVDYAKQASGGILFIDEIYSLHHKGDNNDQGKQGIEVLLKVIEDKRDDFVFIGAGYVNEVNEFLGSNPGILSRVAMHIDFEDYTIDQLLDIATGMFDEQDYAMDASFKELFLKCMEKEIDTVNFGNARVVRNIVESSIRQHALRLFNSDQEIHQEDLNTICGEDFHYKKVEENIYNPKLVQ